MNQLENDYGPLMLEELKKRLNKTIEEFQHDVESVLKNAFENHKLKYENSVSDLSETEDEVPSYISDYENKKKIIRNNSVLDGKLAVSCNLKPAICRIEFNRRVLLNVVKIY